LTNGKFSVTEHMCLHSLIKTTRGHLFALLAEFAHDLSDVDGGVGGHLGLLLLLLLPDDDGAETGTSVSGILLQLGFTRVSEKKR